MADDADRIIAIPDGRAFEAVVLAADKPVAVVFCAQGSALCRRFWPIFRRLAERFAGRAVFASVDVDLAPDVQARWRVSTLPTVLLFREGRVVHSYVNIQDDQPYATALDLLTTRTA